MTQHIKFWHLLKDPTLGVPIRPARQHGHLGAGLSAWQRRFDLGEPGLIHHLLRQLFVEMWNNEVTKRKRHLIVFTFAATSAALGQVFLLHKVLKQHRISAIGETEEIVEALRGSGVNVRERRKRCRHFRTLTYFL